MSLVESDSVNAVRTVNNDNCIFAAEFPILHDIKALINNVKGGSRSHIAR